MKRLLLLTALVLPLAATAAGVGYRIVHPDGTVEFTDDPHRGGEKIDLYRAPAVDPYAPLEDYEKPADKEKQSPSASAAQQSQQ